MTDEYSLHADVALLKAEMHSHVNAAACFREETSAHLQDISKRLAAGDTQFALQQAALQSALASIGDRIGHVHAAVTSATMASEEARASQEIKIRALEDDKLARDAQQGLVARFLGSKLVLWFLGCVASAGAFLWGRTG